jgi:cytochrome c biogenesis protein CcdA
MPIGTLGLAFVAGTLSVLSPCVLPLLPIVLGTAASEHRLGPAALAAGLAVSFTAIGLFVATIGFAAGLDTGVFRTVSAVLLIAVGVVLLVPKLQDQFALAAGPVSNWAGGYADNFTPGSLFGQFGLGLLLGAVWSPCVGPTLGAASVLAAKGEDLAQVALTMLAFGIGAALPLMLLGLLSREAMMRWRGRLMETGKAGKTLLGVLLVAVGLLVATNLDKRIETVLVDASPAWLTGPTSSKEAIRSLSSREAGIQYRWCSQCEDRSYVACADDINARGGREWLEFGIPVEIIGQLSCR